MVLSNMIQKEDIVKGVKEEENKPIKTGLPMEVISLI